MCTLLFFNLHCEQIWKQDWSSMMQADRGFFETYAQYCCFFYINTKTRLMETGIESCTTCVFTYGQIWFIYTEWLFFFFLSSCFYTDLSHVRLQQMLSTWHHLVGWSYHPSAQHVKKKQQYLVRMPPPQKKTTTTIQANKKHRHSVSLPHKNTKLTTKNTYFVSLVFFVSRTAVCSPLLTSSTHWTKEKHTNSMKGFMHLIIGSSCT